MATKSKGKSVPSHAQAMQRVLKSLRAWEAHDEENRAEHTQAMRTLLAEAAGDSVGDVTVNVISDLYEEHYDRLRTSGKQGAAVLTALDELTGAAKRLATAFERSPLAGLRLSIDVHVRAPSTRELKDLRAILAVEGPSFASEVCGTVFGQAYEFVSAKAIRTK